jgi:phage regulator Rha-like protein
MSVLLDELLTERMVHRAPMVGPEALVRIAAMEPRATYGIGSVPDSLIAEKLHFIRGQKVMLDRDLAELYGVEVKRLKEQVRRNMDRFPVVFMFELTKEEAESSRSQNATLKQGENIKYLPFAFTEHGILMLANVLRSQRAIAVSIRIIDLFVRMRDVMAAHQDILLRLEQLERRVGGHGTDIQVIFHHLKQLLAQPVEPRKRIGFKPDQA